MSQPKKTVGRTQKSTNSAPSKTVTRKGFKTYTDSKGRPYIKVAEAIKSEAGQKIFKDLETLRQAS